MKLFTEILPKLPTLLLLLLSASGVITGDFFAKYWSQQPKLLYLIIAILGYTISAVFYIPTLLKNDLVTTSVVWSCISIVGFLIIGLVLFHEQLSVVQYVGVGFGVLALVILSAA